VGWVEIHQIPEVGEEVYLDQLDLVLAHEDGEQQNQDDGEARKGREDRPAQPLHHHHVAQPDQLRAARERANVAHDLAARRLMRQVDRPPVEPDVVLTRHGTCGHARSRGWRIRE